LDTQDVQGEIIENEKLGLGGNTVLVGSGILYHDGKFLLVKPKNHSYWFFVGGLYDVSGETVEDLIKREYKEELGIMVEVVCPIYNRVDTSPESKLKRLVIHYLVKKVGDEDIKCIDNNDHADIEKFRWVNLDEVRDLPTAAKTREIMEKALKIIKDEVWKS